MYGWNLLSLHIHTHTYHTPAALRRILLHHHLQQHHLRLHNNEKGEFPCTYTHTYMHICELTHIDTYTCSDSSASHSSSSLQASGAAAGLESAAAAATSDEVTYSIFYMSACDRANSYTYTHVVCAVRRLHHRHKVQQEKEKYKQCESYYTHTYMRSYWSRSSMCALLRIYSYVYGCSDAYYIII